MRGFYLYASLVKIEDGYGRLGAFNRLALDPTSLRAYAIPNLRIPVLGKHSFFHQVVPGAIRPRGNDFARIAPGDSG